MASGKISVLAGKNAGMPYTRLGNTGTFVSRICLGCMSYGDKKWRAWVLEEEESLPFFRRALELGINMFDTSCNYSLGVSEEITGRALNQLAHRDEIVVATKVFGDMSPSPNMKGLSRKWIMASCDASLRRLGMEYIDLFQIHRWDHNTPIEETMEALHDLVRLGKVRYIGASSMTAWQFSKAQYTAEIHGWTKFITMQNHYNLVYREEEREMIPLCLDMKVGLIPWSPLARGFLAGTRQAEDRVKKDQDENKQQQQQQQQSSASAADSSRAKTDSFAHDLYYAPEDFEIVKVTEEVAKRYAAKPVQVALAWMLSKPGITSPIIGCTKMYQLEEAAEACKLQLKPEDVQLLEAKYVPHKVLGFTP